MQKQALLLLMQATDCLIELILFYKCSVIDNAQCTNPARNIQFSTCNSHIFTRSKKAAKMIEAASLSARRRDSLTVLPCSQRWDLASYEVTRSSCKNTGTGSESAKLRAMRRASADISLSVPSDSNGKPITSALASNSEIRSLMFESGLFQLVRVTTASGRVVTRSSSQT